MMTCPQGWDLRVQRLVQPDVYRCLSCNACRAACTMHGATSKLQPLKLLRMATIGLRTHVLRAPELWYCLQCNQCSQACPMQVDAASLIGWLRDEAIREGVIDGATQGKLDVLRAGLQRARRHAIARCMEGEEVEVRAEDYDRWSEAPVESGGAGFVLGEGRSVLRALEDRIGYATGLSACMTCGACTSVCPATWDRSVFDPVVLFRMVNLGLGEEVLRSPALWMCLECGRCTKVCTQGVAGHLVIKSLQALAVEGGMAPADMRERVGEVHRALFPWYLAKVDALLAGRAETTEPSG